MTENFTVYGETWLPVNGDLYFPPPPAAHLLYFTPLLPALYRSVPSGPDERGQRSCGCISCLQSALRTAASCGAQPLNSQT